VELKNKKTALLLPVVIALGTSLFPIASADQARNAVGKVLSISGPAAGTIVLRGQEAFELVAGDFLFEGDRVFTRTQNRAVLEIDGCNIELVAASFLEVDNADCEVGAAILDASNELDSVALDIAADETVGAAIPLTPLLAAGATSAAAAGVAAAQGDDAEAPSIVD